MTDKKKNEILMDANKKLQEENDQLKQENEALKQQFEGGVNRAAQKYKKEQKQLVHELASLKNKYQKELLELRRSKNQYETIIRKKFGVNLH